MAAGYSIYYDRDDSESSSIADGAQTGLDLSGDATLECWTYPLEDISGTGEAWHLIIKHNDTGGGVEPYALLLFDDGGTPKIRCYVHSANTGLSGETCEVEWDVSSYHAANTWTWYGVTIDISEANATKMELFAKQVGGTATSLGNGTVTDGVSCASIYNGDGAFSVGDDNENPGLGINGYMADVRVWNTVRTSSQLDAFSETWVPASANLVTNNYFGVRSHSDRSGNGNTLTPNNNPYFVKEYPYPLPTEAKDAVEGDSGLNPTWVLAIEGYSRLITSGDPTAVKDAWLGTDWEDTTPLTGLFVPGPMEQSIVPFRPEIEHDVLRFVIQNDEDETFAKAVFKTAFTFGSDARTKLGSATDTTGWTADADATAFFVEDTGDFSAGDIHIGCENVDVTIASGGEFAARRRGQYSPFKSQEPDNNLHHTWGRTHKVSQTHGTPVVKPEISDFPRTWIGKWVGLWLHVPAGSGLSNMASSQLEWSGRIQDIEDGGKNTTVLSCTDAREVIESTVLMAEQYKAKPVEGMYYQGGERLYVKVIKWDPGFERVDMEWLAADDLAGGSGQYTAHEIVDSIQDEFNEFVAANSSFFGTEGSLSINIDAEGHVVIKAKIDSANTSARLEMTSLVVLRQHFGFDSHKAEAFNEGGTTTDPEVIIRSENPYTIYFLLSNYWSDINGRALGELNVGNVSGTWINQADFVPNRFKSLIGPGENWGFVKFGDWGIALAKYNNDTNFSKFYFSPDLNEELGLDPRELSVPAVRWHRVSDGEIDIKQVLIVQDRTSDLIKKIFYSTGTTGYNHATFDVLPYGMGASIPADLLGAAFEQSVDNMDSDLDTYSSIIIDKPTKFSEILNPAMQLRNAYLLLRNGGLVFMAPSRPSAADSQWTLIESNKAAPSDTEDVNRSRTDKTSDLIINDIKIEYNRDLKGQYKDVISLPNEASKTDHGIAKPLTIRARGHFGSGSALGDDIQRLASELAGYAFTLFGKPVTVVTRSINVNLFNIIPGDIVAITDNDVRSNLTGERGITAQPAWVMEVQKDWSTLTGQIKVVLTDYDPTQYAPYSPCAQVDDTATNGGYVAGTKTLTFYAHEHSYSDESADVSHFAAGDKVNVIEISPTDPTSPQNWDDTIVSVDATTNTCVLTTGLSGWDSSVKYRMVSQERSAAQSSQQSDCYLADDADNKIEDNTFARAWAIQPSHFFDLPTPTATDRYVFPIDNGNWETDGLPVHPGMHRDIADNINIMLRRRTVINFPFILQTGATETSSTYIAHIIMPVYLGGGDIAQAERVLNAACLAKVSGGGTLSIRLTSSASRPIGESSTAVEFAGEYNQTETTSTSSSTLQVGFSDLNIAVSGNLTWITVEMKTTAGTATLYGLPKAVIGESDQ